MAVSMLREQHTATCLRCLQVDLQDKLVKLSFCPFCAYAGGNDLSYLNHIIIAHYNVSYGCWKCLKQAFVSSSALHNHKKVCIGFVTKKSAAGSDSKPSSGGGGDGSHSDSTRATPPPRRGRSSTSFGFPLGIIIGGAAVPPQYGPKKKVPITAVAPPTPTSIRYSEYASKVRRSYQQV